MIVLDAGILIAFANPDDAHHRGATRFLGEFSGEPFSVTPVTLAEALIHPVRGDIVGETLKALSPLELHVTEVHEADAAALARVLAATGLKMPDALVIHTAERFGGSVVTTEARMAAAAESRGLVVHQI
jgi:predicted nucleic acid-binding protein